MNWITQWNNNRRLKRLKRRILQMKQRIEEVERNRLVPTFDTVTERILRERIMLLEKAVENIETNPGAHQTND